MSVSVSVPRLFWSLRQLAASAACTVFERDLAFFEARHGTSKVIRAFKTMQNQMRMCRIERRSRL